MQNNNLFNGNLFQQTPQKSTGWGMPGTGGGMGNNNMGSNMAGGNPLLGNTQPGGTLPGSMGNPLNNTGSLFNPAANTNNMFNTFGKPNALAPFGQGANQSSLFGGQAGTNVGAARGTFNTLGASSMSNAPPFNQSYNSQFSTAGGSAWPVSSSAGLTSKGSKVAPYTHTKVKEDTGFDAECMDITAMKEYNNTCTDLIRIEDYEMMRRPVPKFGAVGSTIGSSGSTGLAGIGNTMGGSAGQASTNVLGSSSGFNPLSSTSNMFNRISTTNNPPVNTFASTSAGAFNGPSASVFSNPPASTFSNPPMSTLNSAFNGQATGTFQPTASNNSSLFQNNASLIANQPWSSTVNGTTGTPGLFNPQAASTNFGSSLFGTGTHNLASSGTSAAAGGPSASAGLNTNPFGTTTNPFASATGQPNASSGLFGTSANPFAANTTANATSSGPFGTAGLTPSNQFTTGSFTSPFSGSASMSSAPANLNDPYLIKELQFEKIESQKLPVKAILPTPIFDTKKSTFSTPILFRPPRKIHNSNISTIPEISDGAVNIPNLTIKFAGCGKIEYLEPVTVDTVASIEKRVRFSNDSVEISDEPGTGLNKRARIYVEGVYPYSRSTNTFIKGVVTDSLSKSVQDRFIYHLKNDAAKKFVDYDIESGLYVYEVNHF